ncbi:glycosyltransferase [Emticicia fluvialis]|uniref:glycosyltransferase n=1 Tax=Emticicia fluvialis TaxID=2974474 RepID=UPI002165C810|nr:glycosyltransferase [Emticicia fluvialis]
MTLAFTLCSVNYLAQAHTLGDSLKKHNPDFRFVIGLVDKLDTKDIDTSKLPDYPLLELDKIQIADLPGMCERYDITELNTAVKPYYLDYFLRNNPEATNIIYFDPDIIVFDKLTHLEESLQKYDIVVTPHTTTPYNDTKWQNEEDIVNTGVFNFGFVAIRRSDSARKMVDWWCQKLEKECLIDLCNGLFVDQHWADFFPVYFDNVLINKHLGYNVAYWNLHERICTEKDGKWFINNSTALQFFHYSGYLIAKPNEVSKYQNRINFEDRPDIVALFELYRNELLKNNELYWKHFKCDYIKPPKIKRYLRVRKYLKLPLEKLAQLVES